MYYHVYDFREEKKKKREREESMFSPKTNCHIRAPFTESKSRQAN